MTNCISRLDRGSLLDKGSGGGTGASYDSAVWFDAAAVAGVRFAVARISLGRRIELARKMREIGRKAEFLEAGGAAGKDAGGKIEAAVIAGEIDRAYLEWGLVAIEGLTIDGEPATPAMVIERGPVELGAEALTRVKAEWGLSETERKN